MPPKPCFGNHSASPGARAAALRPTRSGHFRDRDRSDDRTGVGARRRRKSARGTVLVDHLVFPRQAIATRREICMYYRGNPGPALTAT